MLKHRVAFTLTASSLEDASSNTALSLPKQMQISLQAWCRCVLLYCCLTNCPNGSGLKQQVLCFCRSAVQSQFIQTIQVSGSGSSQQTSPISRLAWDGAPLQLPHSSPVLQQDSLWAVIGHLTSFKSCGGNFLS